MRPDGQTGRLDLTSEIERKAESFAFGLKELL
jgi:hypothetical protein